jgi:iron complex outermembrane recepter protein
MIRKTARLSMLCATSTLLNVLYPTHALAQQQTTAPSDQLAEVLVTATKRETTVQDTPISITAISGADIEARGYADFDTLAQSLPSVGMQTGGPGQTAFEMRGLSSSGGASPTVGFYLDDIPLTGIADLPLGKVVIDPNLYDLNRVEVLRGPQGTLYGSSSMGGTIKVVPNAPNPAAFDASAELIPSYTDRGDDLNHGENAMVNIPFGGGTAALRIVASQDHESGWIDRIVIAEPSFPLETNNLQTRGNVLAAPVAADYRDVNDEDLTGLRAALLWKPTDNLEITPSYLYQEIRMDGQSDIDSDPGTYAHYQPFDSPEPYSDRIDVSSVNIKYRFDNAELTSTTAYWTRAMTYRQDGSEEWQWAFSTPTAILPFYTSQGGIGAATPTPWQIDKSEQTSEEVRLASTGKSPFQWLVGYFYQDLIDTDTLSILIPGAAPLFGTSNLFTSSNPLKVKQNAFFGELSYEITPGLKATVGLRRYSYDTYNALDQSGVVSSTGSNAYAYTIASESNQGVTPKFDLSYELDKNLLLYATASKGFRPGGGNFGIPTSGSTVGDACEAELMANAGTTSFVPEPLTYGPDQVWSYEVGEKATLLDNRLTINTSAYFENWEDVQQTVGLTCGFNYTANAGDAHIYGGEVEINALVTEGLMLSGNAGYTHAEFASLAAGIPPGTPVLNVPEWTSSVSLVYRHSLANSLNFIARVENNFVDGHYDNAGGIIHELPSYDLTNLRMGVEGGRWTAVLFAKNLFNREAPLDFAYQGINLTIPTFNRLTISQPLTVGIDLTWRLGR